MIKEKERVKALDLAKWFIREGLDDPRNTFSGNMKLQKLIYFSQLIHLAKFNEPLFDDPIFAFKQGSVIENVRQVYKNNFQELLSESLNSNYEFTDGVKETLALTKQIFGGLSAKELSEINHQQHSWIYSYERSLDKEFNFHFKEKGIIKVDEIVERDLIKVKQMIYAFENYNEPESYRVINGITFYFDPSETTVDESVIKELEEFAMNCEEETYSFYIDDNLGLVIY